MTSTCISSHKSSHCAARSILHTGGHAKTARPACTMRLRSKIKVLAKCTLKSLIVARVILAVLGTLCITPSWMATGTTAHAMTQQPPCTEPIDTAQQHCRASLECFTCCSFGSSLLFVRHHDKPLASTRLALQPDEVT